MIVSASTAKLFRRILSAICVFGIACLSFSQQPNTISADPYTGEEFGGLSGRVFGPANTPVPGTAIIIMDEYLTTIYGETVSYGIQAEYQAGFLPVGIKLKLFAFIESVPNSLFFTEFELKNREVKKIIITLPLPGGSSIPGNIAEVILRGQYTDYVTAIKNTIRSINEPPPASTTTFNPNDFLNTARIDIGQFRFADENGKELAMYAISGLGNDPHAFARTFENRGSLKEFGQRKKIYKEVLYELAFQQEMHEINMLEAYNGTNSSDDLITSFNDIMQGLVTGTEVSVAIAEFASEEKLKLLKYSAGSNYYKQFLNKLKSAGRNVRHGSLTNFSKVLEGISVITGSIQFVQNAWIITNSALMLKAVQYDIGILRLEKLAQNSKINDLAFRQALSEVILELKTPPSDMWEKILTSIDHNKEALNSGAIGLGDVIAGSLSLGIGTSAAHIAGAWAGSILFAYETYQGIQTWENNLQAAAVAATIYGDLIEYKADKPSFEEAELIEYSQITFYSKMDKVMKNGYLQFFALFRPSQREVRDYLENEYNSLVKNVAKKRLYWYKSTFTKKPSLKAGITTLGFILDSSGSMQDSDPNDIRKSAVEQIIDILSGSENFFLVDFDGTSRWHNQNSWKGWNRDQLKNAVRMIDSDGNTNVGLGISTMREAFEKSLADFSQTAVVLLTDGMGGYNGEADWFAQKGIKIYTVSYKDKADASLMNLIAGVTNGVYIQANDESDVVAAFMQFNNDLQGMSKFTSVRGSTNGQSSVTIPSFYVDPNCTQMTTTINWTGTSVGYTLISPQGTSYAPPANLVDNLTPSNHIPFDFEYLASNSNPGHGPNQNFVAELTSVSAYPAGKIEWMRGKTYIMAKISNPEPGEWKATLRTMGSTSGNSSFLFEAMGTAAKNIEIRTSKGSPGTYLYKLSESAPDLLWTRSKASITLNTPTGKKLDITANYKNGSFFFYPGDGTGNYKVEATLWIPDAMNNTLQRHFSRSELVGEVFPGYIAQVKETMGLFIVTDQGLITGNRPGIKCVVYPAGGSASSPKATGFVTHVNEKECTIKITDLKTGRLEKGDIVELDMLQWQNDK